MQTLQIPDNEWGAFRRAFERDHPVLELRSLGVETWEIALVGSAPIPSSKRPGESS